MVLSLPVLAVFVVCALDLIVAGVIVSQKPKSAVNLSFALFALSGALWALGISFFLSLTNPYWIDFFARLLYTAGSCVTISFYLFAITFRTGTWPSLSKTVIVFAPALLLFVLFFFSDLMLTGYLITADGFRGFDYGPLHLLFDLTLWGFFAAALITCYSIYRESDHTKGRQALVIMIGTAVNVSLATASNIVGPSLFNYFEFLWVGPFAMIVWVSSVAYAVSKYQLFSMRVIYAEFFVISLWIFLLVRFFLSNSTQDFWINGVSFLVVLVLGLFVVRSVINEVEQREIIVEQSRELEEANKKQENLLHFISHEVKGYMTKSEAAFSAISTGDFGTVTPELQSMSELALDDMRKGVNTITDILDASNLKKGTVAYNRTKFDLAKTIEVVVDDLRKAAAEKGLALTYHKPVTGACTVDGDEDKIRRHVIRNIIDNSIKYTPSGSVKVDLVRDHNVLRMVVSDTGVGITPEDMKNLFTEGGHGKDSIRINVHSTGYGLFIAKEIVDNHQGHVWAESAGEGKGSRFIVEFPAA